MRSVYFTQDFFDLLDEIFDMHDGEPTRNQFEALDLWLIKDYFAGHWDDLPSAIPGRDDYRERIGKGETVATYRVIGQLREDGAIELMEIDIQFEVPQWMDPDD